MAVPLHWSSLAPARRRFYLGIVTILVTAVVAVLVVNLVQHRADRVVPVAQGRPGPVLLVPGYGGSVSSLRVLGEALAAQGRDVVYVDPPGDGTGDLRDAARNLAATADAVLGATGASSVDVVGYSAGGVIVRYWVAELGGGGQARRVVTLSSPHHGTDLAAVAGGVAPDACPTACQQLAPDSELLTGLNAGDETPPGPRWVSIWTTDDQTVVPPNSARLAGALDYTVQELCPGLVVSHGDMPRTPVVIAGVESAIGPDFVTVPIRAACGAALSR